MPLLELDIPPGVTKNGTGLQQSGSWADANLIRWYENTMQPIGGWRKRTSSTMTGIARALLVWLDNGGGRRTAAGTPSKLYAIADANTLHDITPSGLTVGTDDAVQNLGWNALTYGAAEYGTPRPDSGSYTPATTWSLDSWGQYLIACSNKDGKIYEWQLNNSTVAAAVTNAPTDCSAIVATEERFIFALGAGGVGNKVQWCDQEVNTTWTPASTNQAGDFTLNTAGNLVSGHSLRGETLLLTDTDAHVARYVGNPYVYSFSRVGTGCGAISANGCVVADGFACWMGRNGFHIYRGGVQQLASSVGDYVFSNFNEAQRSKVYGVLNSAFSEITWYYPSGGATENDSYVTFNYRENHWAIGSIARTAGVDAGIFVYPNLVGADGFVYEHEVGFSYDSEVPFAETGPLKIGSGDRLMVATSLIPDEKTQGDCTSTFKTRMYPNGTESTHGPFTLTNPTSVRFQGRQVRMRITSDVNTDWRVGTMRLDIKAGSGR